MANRFVMGRCAALGFVLLIAAASAHPIPQGRQLDEGLRKLGLASEIAHKGRLSRGRFPLSFPAERSHGVFKSNTGYRLAAHGHGVTSRGYSSVSFELLFWDLTPHFETDLATTKTAMQSVGLPGEVQDTVIAGLLDLRRRLAAAPPDPLNPASVSRQVKVEVARVAAGVHVRMEGRMSRGPGGDGGHVIVQFTDARAPQAAWPAPAEVEALFPYSRRRFRDVGADILAADEPEVFDLRCRPAGSDAFRCSYVVTVTDWLQGKPPRDRYNDRFSKRGGKWVLLAPDAIPDRH